MKNVTKVNILFTFMTAFYLLVIFAVRLVPAEWIGTNVRLILPEIIMLIPAFLYVTLMKPAGLKSLQFEVPSVGNTIRIILMTVCLLPAVSLINSVTSLFTENKVSDVMGGLTVNPLWLNIILMALIPAICEEYIFRGLIFHGYKKRNPFGAIMMSSFLFALMHMNLNQFVYAFIMGIVFCMLVYATGTIMASITAHFVFNGINVIMAHKAADILSESTESEISSISNTDYIASYIILILIAAAGIYGAGRLFKRICEANRGFSNVMLIFKRENRKAYDSKQGKFFDGYVCTGIVLCMVYIIIYGI